MTAILIRSFAPKPPRSKATIAERLLPAQLRSGREPIKVPGPFETQPKRTDLGGSPTRQEAPEPLASEVAFGVRFDGSINPYRGCLHRPARQGDGGPGRSAALDFEDRLFARQGAAELLERELASETYWPAPIVFGQDADPYQPIECQYRIARSLLQTLRRARHPLSMSPNRI